MTLVQSLNNYDFLFKLLLIGDSGVGKSSLVRRFSDDEFSTHKQPTIGVDFTIRTIDVDGKFVKLQIWDTAGQERYHTMRLEYYRCTKGFIVVFDLTNEKSFQNVDKWMQTIENYDEANVILIGNKCDLTDRRKVSTDTAYKYAYERNITYLETSALTSKNVIEMIAMYSNIPDDNTNSIILGETAEVSGGWFSGYCSYL